MTVPLLPPSRLAVFATDPDTGNPVTRLPLFAELAVPRLLVRAPLDEHHREPIRGALLELDPDMDHAVRDRLEAAMLAALAEILPEEERDGILGQTTRFRDWVQAAIKAAMRAAGVERPGALAQTDLAARLTHGLREAARDVGLALPAQAEPSDLWAEPLGVLTTDHMGYASFDLTRLSATATAALATAIARLPRPSVRV